MNKPEIARRCATCGASIRKRAQFCPQCGDALSIRTEEPDASEEPVTETAESRDTILEMSPIDSADAESRQTLLLNSDLIKPKSETDVVPDLSKTLPLDAPFPPTQPLSRDGGVGQTSGGLPDKTQPLSRKSVEDSKAPVTPVQKLKRVSSVVIDQAAYDPSIRFLLVAAVLFILFLFLLIMSKILS
jgi:zinc-ribbon domain